MSHTKFLLRLAPLAVLVLIFSLGAGCKSTPIQRDMMTEALSAGEQPVAMKGDAAFLDGKLVVTSTVSRGFGLGTKGARPDGKPGRIKQDDVYSDSSLGGFGDSEDAQKEAMENYVRLIKAQRAAGSPMPPVTLRVTFENRTAAPLEIEVLEVNSELGNFVARPAKLTVAPGQAAALDPMISQLGVSSDEIPVKVGIRAAGTKEAKTFSVRSVILPSAKK